MNLRPVGDRVLLKRVKPRGRLISHVGEQLGITDTVMQLGEVVGIGPKWASGRFADDDLAVGDLVVYPSPRIHDHFTWQELGKSAEEILVIPGYWVSAIVKDWFLADNPELREFGVPLT